MREFHGFPAAGKATSIPNLFFETVLPQLDSSDPLLAFLWVARLTQEQQGEAQCVTADEVWANPAARSAFENLSAGREGLDTGLDACLEHRALLALRLGQQAGGSLVYFVNNPRSRRAITRAQAGQLRIRRSRPVEIIGLNDRPDIFRLYEEQLGTITPLVAEKLAEAADQYPIEWIEDAFREAAERNVRNWRYIERVLESWSTEGHGHEATARDSLEDRKRRYLGGDFGHLARYR
jgi:DNA replication protein